MRLSQFDRAKGEQKWTAAPPILPFPFVPFFRVNGFAASFTSFTMSGF